ncbi:hypothetical protein SmJEL517_g00538 [Synchytrium microbalum]|uniref:Uncharacterized protein n=1 Tax=Synchytrium microbalum TaxID=1806994 RepID=A0A507CJ19_9FUNG|nr:uncharacterized protein SmJEL517_g00538 [Synchytrium microbalum]TPX37703.1 hypothetical protein SmJEL517_g00538 [Synchytrium microbalum]
MGCDGGSIPTRRELVKEKPKTIIPDAVIQQIQQWLHCALSKQPLAAPIVSCGLGKLYNKEAILSYLVNKAEFGDGDTICRHITSLKDVTTLNLQPNPVYSKSHEDSNAVTNNNTARTIVSPFVCPITLKEMNGKHRFSYISTCGCVFSEAGLKQVPDPGCPNCGKLYTAQDVIPINSLLEDEIARLHTRMDAIKAERVRVAEERKAEKALAAGGDKKNTDGKKRKKEATNDTTTDNNSNPHKKQAITNTINKNINASIPSNLNAKLAVSSAKLTHESEAIQSLYAKKAPGETKKQTWMTQGTFTRYSNFA